MIFLGFAWASRVVVGCAVRVTGFDACEWKRPAALPGAVRDAGFTAYCAVCWEGLGHDV